MDLTSFNIFNTCSEMMRLYATLALFMCVLSYVASSSPAPHGTHGSSVAFISLPGDLADSLVVRLRSRCSEPCLLTLELLVSTPNHGQLLVFQKTWADRVQDRPESDRTYRTRLRLPPSLVFRRGFFNRHVIDARSGVLRAWLAGLNDSSESGSYHGSTVSATAVLRVAPPTQRPPRPPTGCPSWSAELLWTRTITTHQCPHGPEVEHLLCFPAVSTGERFGVVRTFHRFTAIDLENHRLHAVTQPRVTVSVWLYLLEWCQSKLCGVLLHVNKKQEFDSVLMLLTDTGGVVIQTRLTSGEDKSFHAHASLPLLTWIRLDCSVHHNEVRALQEPSGRFQTSVRYDDTDGYFVIGGSRYMPGIHGYFGPIVFYRLGTTRVDNPLPLGNMLEKLNQAHRSCRQITTFTHAFSQAVTRGYPFLTKGVCHSHDGTLWTRSQEPKCKQTWAWRTQHKFTTLFHFLRRREEDSTSGEKALGDHLFEYVAERMFSVDHTQVRLTSSLRALLKASCCLGNQHAPLLLATVHLAGLDQPSDQEQGHVYSLMGALGDHRLALMHLGYKHSQGLDGFPRDLEVAYSCYANTATQTVSDDDRPHENHQYVVEHIHLNNKEHLKAVVEGGEDVIHFLKLKAESGDVPSQARLFHGEHIAHRQY
ncbi:Protein sel-1 3 [Merluccius polli]|uniref:Protein sel-1 3 n=1 Tax=Merluccius polli TaxID=89951 RepID=A0AA47MKD6_MERPO|nr:Protein sel-1 3 [Merluccius polli]